MLAEDYQSRCKIYEAMDAIIDLIGEKSVVLVAMEDDSAIFASARSRDAAAAQVRRIIADLVEYLRVHPLVRMDEDAIRALILSALPHNKENPHARDD